MKTESESVAERAREVLPGLWHLRTRLPGHRLGWMNSYLLASADGAIVIDTPWGRPEVRDEFLDAIAETGTDPGEIRMVLLTHYHDDHSGCAAHLQRLGASVAIHPADTEAMRSRFADATYAERLERWLGRVGADAELVEYARQQQASFSERFEVPAADFDLVDGQVIEAGPWRLLVVHTPGHTPGSVCFLELGTGTLFSGDHVFPLRRSNAVHRPVSADRPLEEYWKGMDRLAALAPERVMPGHEHPFDHFDARIAELAAVRDRKLDEVLTLLVDVRQGASAADLAPRIRRRVGWAELDGNSRLTAIGETLAYLIELEHDRRLEATDAEPQHWRIREDATTR